MRPIRLPHPAKRFLYHPANDTTVRVYSPVFELNGDAAAGVSIVNAVPIEDSIYGDLRTVTDNGDIRWICSCDYANPRAVIDLRQAKLFNETGYPLCGVAKPGAIIFSFGALSPNFMVGEKPDYNKGKSFSLEDSHRILGLDNVFVISKDLQFAFSTNHKIHNSQYFDEASTLGVDASKIADIVDNICKINSK